MPDRANARSHYASRRLDSDRARQNEMRDASGSHADDGGGATGDDEETFLRRTAGRSSERSELCRGERRNGDRCRGCNHIGTWICFGKKLRSEQQGAAGTRAPADIRSCSRIRGVDRNRDGVGTTDSSRGAILARWHDDDIAGQRIDQPLAQNGASLIGSYTTPASTINAKPSRIETGWETVRWSLFRDGATCPWMDPGKVQYYKGLAAEIRRVEQERNDAARDLIKVGMNDQAESTRLSNKKNAAITRLRQLGEMTAGSPFYDGPRGTPLSAQSFSSSGCGTKG